MLAVYIQLDFLKYSEEAEEETCGKIIFYIRRYSCALRYRIVCECGGIWLEEAESKARV